MEKVNLRVLADNHAALDIGTQTMYLRCDNGVPKVRMYGSNAEYIIGSQSFQGFMDNALMQAVGNSLSKGTNF
jgi:hypothetical protein